jgi:hypothetical protein
MMISFSSLDRHAVQGRGDVLIVSLDRDTADFSHLLGHDVQIDGKVVRVVGVERFAHSPPWRAGEHIGLLIA